MHNKFHFCWPVIYSTLRTRRTGTVYMTTWGVSILVLLRGLGQYSVVVAACVETWQGERDGSAKRVSSI